MRRPFTMGTYCPVSAGAMLLSNEIACVAIFLSWGSALCAVPSRPVRAIARSVRSPLILFLCDCWFLHRGGDFVEVGAEIVELQHRVPEIKVALHMLFGTLHARHDLVNQCS